MKLPQVVQSVFEKFPVHEVMRHVKQVTDFDRPQGSVGLEQAASYVAKEAINMGLTDVEILKLPVDGNSHWWTFKAPTAWSPVYASLSIDNLDEKLVAYPDIPCSLAVRSQNTPNTGVKAPIVEWTCNLHDSAMAEHIVVIPKGADLPIALTQIENSKAIGFVTDATYYFDELNSEWWIGRLELPSNTRMFGFCVSSEAMNKIRQAKRLKAIVKTKSSTYTPAVTARVKGSNDREVLLLAHLCHTGPAANDNASGVAALLGIGQVLQSIMLTKPYYSIRFLFAPEFVGSAAYLYECIVKHSYRLPLAAINLDMVGENQHLCGGPLILERVPEHVPSYLSALAEFCLNHVPRGSHSYSGAVEVDVWHWIVTPFAGGSDHSLFADRSVSRPAIQIGHWPDKFNHTSADTLDKVDPQEIRRAASVAGALTLFLANISELEAPITENIVAQWGASRISEAIAMALNPKPFDPNFIAGTTSSEISGLVAHVTEYAIECVASLSELFEKCGHDRRQILMNWLYDVGQIYERTIAHLPLPTKVIEDYKLQRDWKGPFNLRGMIRNLDHDDRLWIEQCLRQDKKMYTIMLAIALAIDGSTGRTDVLRKAAYSSQLCISKNFGNRFIDLMINAGWVSQKVFG